MIETIFFDFDGVIVESVDIKTRAFAKLFEPEGEEAVAKVVDHHLRHAGVSRYDKFRHIYSEILHRQLGGDEFRSLCDRFANLVIDEVVKAPYVKGALEFLDNHASAYDCYILSATPQNELEDIVARRGICDRFKAVYGAPFKKSDSVSKILSTEGVKPDHSAYVGDAMSDYEAAVMNKVHFIARVDAGNDIFKSTKCTKVRDLTDLHKILRGIK